MSLKFLEDQERTNDFLKFLGLRSWFNVQFRAFQKCGLDREKVMARVLICSSILVDLQSYPSPSMPISARELFLRSRAPGPETNIIGQCRHTCEVRVKMGKRRPMDIGRLYHYVGATAHYTVSIALLTL
jgi:hypothetical protein